MLNNDITFSADGPIMSGTWHNPKTGDSFTVRNSFFEDNQYVVQTTDGRILKYNQLQNYVQTKNPNDIPKPQKSIVKESNNDLPAEVAALISDDEESSMLPDEMQQIYNAPAPISLGNLNKSSRPITIHDNPNSIIINKALSKCEQPEFNIKIDWGNKFPEKEIEMLIDLMDINIEEIIDYYIHNMNFEKLADQISTDLTQNILSKFKKEEPKPKVEEKEPVKKTVKKTTTKKTKQ